MDVNSDRWMRDSDRARLEARERDLLDRYDELERASQETATTIDALRKRLVELDLAKRAVRAELNSVKLKLL